MPDVIDILDESSSDDENQTKSYVREIKKTSFSQLGGSNTDLSPSRQTVSPTDVTNDTNCTTANRMVTSEKINRSHDSSGNELHLGKTTLEPLDDRASGFPLQGIRRCLNSSKFCPQNHSSSDDDETADDDSSVEFVGIKSAEPLVDSTARPRPSSPVVFDLCDSDDDIEEKWRTQSLQKNSASSINISSKQVANTEKPIDITGNCNNVATTLPIHECTFTSDNSDGGSSENKEQIAPCEKQVEEVERLTPSTGGSSETKEQIAPCERQVDEVKRLTPSTDGVIEDRKEICMADSTGDGAIAAPIAPINKKTSISNNYDTGRYEGNDQIQPCKKKPALSSSCTDVTGAAATRDSMSEIEFTFDLNVPLGLVIQTRVGIIFVSKVKNDSQLANRVFPSDIVYKIMDQHISSLPRLKKLLSKKPPRREATLVVLRKQHVQTPHTEAEKGWEEGDAVNLKADDVESLMPLTGGVASRKREEFKMEAVGRALVDRGGVSIQEKGLNNNAEREDVPPFIRREQNTAQTKIHQADASNLVAAPLGPCATSPDMTSSDSSESVSDYVSIPSPSLMDEPNLYSSGSDFSPEDHSVNYSEEMSATGKTARPMRTQKSKAISYNSVEDAANLELQLKDYDSRVAKERQCRNKSSAPRILPMTKTTKPLIDDSNVILMHGIPHLTKPTDPLVPSNRFTVHFPNVDWILYDFEIKIKPSQIDKDAGLGAFLVYHGGRRLEQTIDDRNQEKIAYRLASIPKTIQSLTGRFIDGSTAQVTLHGKHLHGYNNSMFQAVTETPLQARLGTKDLSVMLQGEKLHYDSDEDHLDLSCCSKRIGNLSFFIESDYRRERKIVFAPPRGKIAFLDIGRYGPVRKQDRKRKEDLDIKNFLFDNEPAGWCFGVDEQILGSDQLIDVTDDKTGEFHDDAKKLVAPYVNEIGHNSNLIQNVYTRQKGDNCVNYYFAIDRELHAGDEVEMLTDYDGPYEPTRERKGYGEKNLNGKCQSDYNAASKLKRNCLERIEIEKLIKSMSPRELFYSLEFVISQIFPGVKEATESCLGRGKEIQQPGKIPSNRQLRARRRLHWIATVYIERSEQLTGCGLEDGSKVGANAVAEMMKTCKEWSTQLFWDKLSLSSSLPRIPDEKLDAIFNEETVEEVLYYIKDELPEPLNLNLWCRLARDQTMSLCNAAYEQVRGSGCVNKERLAASFICCASDFAAKIREAIKDKRYTLLSFTSGAEKGKNVVDGQQKNLVTLAAGAVLSNSYVLKGAISALLDIKDHYEVIQHKERTDISLIKRGCDDPVLIVKSNFGSSMVDGMPRRIDFVQSGRGEIDEAWYLVWQNVYLTYKLLKGMVQKFCVVGDNIDKFYDQVLSDLCQSLNVDVSLTRDAIKFGFRCDLALPKVVFESEFTMEMMKKNFENDRGANKVGRKRKYQPGAPLAGKNRKKATKKMKAIPPGGGTKKLVNRGSFFLPVVWKTLTQCGWTLERGNRPGDLYFMPPGIQRGSGFRPRVDFFDSKQQVINCLETNGKWKGKAEVIECMKIFDKCQELCEKMKKERKSVDEIVELAQVR